MNECHITHGLVPAPRGFSIQQGSQDKRTRNTTRTPLWPCSLTQGDREGRGCELHPGAAGPVWAIAVASFLLGDTQLPSRLGGLSGAPLSVGEQEVHETIYGPGLEEGHWCLTLSPRWSSVVHGLSLPGRTCPRTTWSVQASHSASEKPPGANETAKGQLRQGSVR